MEAEIDEGRRPPERDLGLEADTVDDHGWRQRVIQERRHAADGGARGRLLEVGAGRETRLPLVPVRVDGAGQQVEVAGIDGRGTGRISPAPISAIRPPRTRISARRGAVGRTTMPPRITRSSMTSAGLDFL